MDTPVCIIDANGITVPTYSDVLTYIQASMRAIYGTDLYLESDSQDGQLAAIFAKAVHDCNSSVASAYNAQSPATAQGNGLSSIIKLNGLQRKLPSLSQVDLLISGDIGAQIVNGIATDSLQQKWMLPALVTIDTTGSVTVTAFAAVVGASAAPINTITSIFTPTRGWVTVSNPRAAVPGQPVETDAQLRVRQSVGASSAAFSTTNALTTTLANQAGVGRIRIYENDTVITNSYGIPAHSIAVVIEGGDAAQIATTILLRRSQGVATFGAISQTVYDSYLISHIIFFSRPIVVPITILIVLLPLSKYTSAKGTSLITAMVAYAQSPASNMNDIGAAIYANRLISPFSQFDNISFDILSIGLSRPGGSADARGNVLLAYNEVPQYDIATTNISLVA